MIGMLIDATRCIGCRGCQVACKEWNGLPAERNTFFKGSGYQNPGRLSSRTWTVVTFNDTHGAHGYDWVFSKQQCFHCIEPSCVTVCPVTALEKTEMGPVVYNPARCLGCRYCQLACPFDVPCFDWDKAVPEIRKCTMCMDRMDSGMKPACAKTCPTNAIVFGQRNDLIKEAQARIAGSPGRYVDHIYGQTEVGGTCVMHISGVPFEALGFRTDLPDTPVLEKSREGIQAIPYVMTGLAVALGFISWVINRRIANEKKGRSDT